MSAKAVKLSPTNELRNHADYVSMVINIFTYVDTLENIVTALKGKDIAEWCAIRYSITRAGGRDPLNVLFNVMDHIPADKLEKHKSYLVKVALPDLFLCAPETLSQRKSWEHVHFLVNNLVTESDPVGWKAKIVKILINKD